MAPKTRCDRCTNPLLLKNHKITKGLRHASRNLCDKWRLSDKMYLCRSCRRTLTDTSPTRPAPTDENLVANISENISDDSGQTDQSSDAVHDVEIISCENNNKTLESTCGRSEKSDELENVRNVALGIAGRSGNVDSQSDAESSQFSSQQLYSQVSVDTRLPVINEALQLLDESPIPKKKLSLRTYVDKKVDKVCFNLKKSLGTASDYELNAQNDAKDFRSLLHQLKLKFHKKNTDRAQKIQILTLLPTNWTTERICHTMNAGKHMVCVAKTFAQKKGILSRPDLKLGSHLPTITCESGRSLNHYSDYLGLIICPNPSPECHFGNCVNCPGTAILQNVMEDSLEKNGIDSVTYKNWVSNPRTSLETFTKSSSEFVETFCEKLTALLPHAFIAKKQALFIKTVKERLNDDEVLVVSDFAENYSFVVQNAAAGLHWNNNQATIYPSVVYFKTDGVLCHKSLVIISDCLSHDAIAVYVFSRIVIDFIESIKPEASKVYSFSDGAPQQFKNFKHFKEDHGLIAEWHFFATAHGKGPCDGIGGTIKRMAARASLQLPPDRQITTARELHEWASCPTNLPNIAVKFSPREDYERAKIFLDSRFEVVKRIPATQKLHCVIPQSNGNVQVKPYSTSEE